MNLIDLLKFKLLILKWYYDKKCIFPIWAILKRKKGSLCKKKNAFYYFQISLFWNLQVSLLIMSYMYTQPWSNMMKKDNSANLYQECLILCSMIVLNVFHNTSWTVLLPWQHTGFETFPILKAFLATYGILFWYFTDGAQYAWSSKYMNILAQVVASFNVFQAENHQHIEIKWLGTGKEWVAMGTEVL